MTLPAVDKAAQQQSYHQQQLFGDQTPEQCAGTIRVALLKVYGPVYVFWWPLNSSLHAAATAGLNTASLKRIH